ncbi:hypothetical protein Tco_1444625 [Tanacetum coccineum]
MRRLHHRLKADAKASIKVVGFYKGCHIAEKVATLLKRLYKGYGLDILHKTNPNRGSYEVMEIMPKDQVLFDQLSSPTFISRDAFTLRLRGGGFDRAFEGPSMGPSTRPSMGPSIRPSRRRPGASLNLIEVFSIWKAFGGNTRDLGSFEEETDKITNQHQDSSRFKVSKPRDSVTIYTRRRHTSSSDGITTSLDGISPH